MRRNQVSIKIERFGEDAPEGTNHQVISVYSDSNDIYEALAGAYYEALTAIQEHQYLPSFGDRSHSSRNE